MDRCCALSLAVSLFGCQSPLPSATPLGSGPLAGEPPGSRMARTAAAEPVTSASVRNSPQPATQEQSEKTEPAQPDEAAPKDADAGAPSSAPADKHAAAVTFAGDYTGSDTTLTRIKGEQDNRQEDPNAILRIEQKDEKLQVLIINSLNGTDVLCTLRAVARGHRADVEGGQTCFDASVESGFVELNEEKLIFELKLSGSIPTDHGERDANIDYRFEGKRK